MEKKKFGETLVDKKLITAEQLKVALENHKKSAGTLGQYLVNEGYVKEEVMKKELGEYYGSSYI